MWKKKKREIRGLDRNYIQTLIKELKLENTEAFYYSLVENIPQYIFCKDLNGNFTFVNQRFCDLLEKPLDEIIGKNDFDFFPPELARKYREDDHKVIEHDQVLEDIEENKVSHRETRYVHVMKTPIHDAEGKIIGMQGIFWDITERKKAEEELKNANEHMRRDLIAASKVQRGFIPENPPFIPGYRFAWLFEPSEYVGGDLLNIIRLDEHRWAFYILDVSGHGVPAALLSVSISRMIDQISLDSSVAGDSDHPHSNSSEFIDLNQLIHMLNRRFPGDKTMFCTLVFAVLDTRDGSVTWARAGHEPPLLVKGNGLAPKFFHDPGGVCISNMPLDERDRSIKKIHLESGDRFILFSDGITEAMRDFQEFGYERLVDIICQTASLPLEESLRILYKRASEWADNRQFCDDVTLLVLERTGVH